ncbi:hypothetical protein WJX79_003412 [Trebouxia sp. C0005]
MLVTLTQLCQVEEHMVVGAIPTRAMFHNIRHDNAELCMDGFQKLGKNSASMGKTPNGGSSIHTDKASWHLPQTTQFLLAGNGTVSWVVNGVSAGW